jgi:hypothetical protein
MTKIDTSFDRLKEQLRIQKAKRALQNTERKKKSFTMTQRKSC